MYTVNSLPIAILFCGITMLGWGSWANTQKLAGKTKWPFELFYWDYAIGVFLLSIVVHVHSGQHWPCRHGGDAKPAGSIGAVHRGEPIVSGVLFNVANILIVVAIDAAGMSVAFPVGIGLALVIGTVKSYAQAPKGNAALLFIGVACVICSDGYVRIGPYDPATESWPRLDERPGLQHHRRLPDGVLLSATAEFNIARF